MAAISFPFETVLIANRGEIAVRIIGSLRKLGLRAAIVYHEVDAATPAVALADVAFKISGRTPVSAYLAAEQIVTAARTVGAGALHPGYGFLSENAGFARAVAAAGIALIRPSPAASELSGDNIRARGPSGPRSWSSPPLAAVARGCGLFAISICWRMRSLRRAVRGNDTSAMVVSISNVMSKSHGISRSRFWAMLSVMWCICLNENVRCSGDSRRSSRKRRHQLSRRRCARGYAKPRRASLAPPDIAMRARLNSFLEGESFTSLR